MAMRLRPHKVRPALIDRSDQPGERVSQADLHFLMALELLLQADEAARARDEMFLASRLSQVDRVLGLIPPDKLVKAVKRAKRWSSALQRGEIPPIPTIRFAKQAQTGNARSREPKSRASEGKLDRWDSDVRSVGHPAETSMR